MIDAKRTMLVLLRELVGCNIVRMQSGNECIFDKITCSPINEEQVDSLIGSSNNTTTKRSDSFDSLDLEFTLFHHRYAQIAIVRQDDRTASNDNSNRKKVSSLQQRFIEVTLDLFCDSTFEKWFISFVQGKNNQCANVSKMKLALSTIVQSYVIFNDYQKYTEDSLTNLHSRTALQSIVDANIKNGDIALCMIHCQDFQGVNRKFGQAQGDVVLNEIAQIIDRNTRDDDVTCRFGGALFGVAMHLENLKDCQTITSNLHLALQSKTFLDNALRLRFNIGAALLSPTALTTDDHSPSSVLIARAEQGLRAAQAADTPSFVIWEQGKFLHDEQEFNHLGGIFTPDNVTNYRNMLLLWDISSVIADEHSFDNLVSNVIERLAYTFEFSFAGVFSSDLNNHHNITVNTDDIDNIKKVQVKSLSFCNELIEAKTKADESKKPIEHQIGDMRCLLIPLGTQLDECFFIMGKEQKFDLTRDSILLFAGFARQIGKALNRSLLEEQLNRKLEAENANLVKELNELKLGLKSNALIYKSDAMQHLLKQTKRAAQTDTTVLITGESGTGKEKLIHALHSLSNRNHKPPIIVDCGSIPETLIESELFGHVKGAFTGASKDKKGKILAADGGVLVLDEIGELPLLMQPKLLRFVQEKHFTPIGSTKPISVDVKIVAVTNRNLLDEAERGNFRKDLYYRLNVITLNNPPLRERTSDIEILSKHFVKKFCHQYELTNRYLSDITIESMKDYLWPGNIRQLENRIMQACLLSQNEEITLSELNLDPAEKLKSHEINNIQQNPSTGNLDISSTNSDVRSVKEALYITNIEKVTLAADAIKTNIEDSKTANSLDVPAEQWNIALEAALLEFVSEIEESLTHHNLNIGDTIEAYIFKELVSGSKTNKQIAEKLNIPISTARRKTNKHQKTRIPSTLPQSWQEIVRLLDIITQSNMHIKEPLAKIKHIVVKAVLEKIQSNMTRAASLIGVSEPTLYKFKKTMNV